MSSTMSSFRRPCTFLCIATYSSAGVMAPLASWSTNLNAASAVGKASNSSRAFEKASFLCSSG